MINYIKDLFTEVRPEIKRVAEHIKEGYTQDSFLLGLYEYKIERLGVSFYFHNNNVCDFSVGHYEFPLTNKERKFLSKAIQQLEKQREEEKVQKAYSLLKSNLEKK